MPKIHSLIVGIKDLPENLALSWAHLDEQFCVKQMSQAFYQRCQRSAAQIINQPIGHIFTGFNEQLREQIVCRQSPHIGFQLHDQEGNSIHFSLYRECDGWYLLLSDINFTDPQFNELHPDYRRIIQASDSWLQHIEDVIKSPQEDIFKVAVAKAMALTGSRYGFILLHHEKSDSLTLVARSAYPNGICAEGGLPEENTKIASSDCRLWLECVKNYRPIIHNLSDNVGHIINATMDNLLLKEAYLAVPILFRSRIMGLVCVLHRSEPYSHSDARSLLTFANILWHSIELPRSLRAVSRQSKIIKAQKEQLSQSLTQLISAISEALELKDAYTAGHQKSVAQLSYLIGEKLGLSPHRLEGLKIGALVHDIGKLAIPSQILTKPAKLSKEEFALIQTHPQHGAEIVEDVEFPWPIREMILQHHERLDGSGYPAGLTDNEILYEAKIIAVADVADSILSHRPYRPSLGLKKMTEVLRDGKGTLYDPEIVETCLTILVNQEISISDHIGSVVLEPIIEISAEQGLLDIKAVMLKSNAKVAIVLDDSQKMIGLVSQAILEHWISPKMADIIEYDGILLHKKAHHIMQSNIATINEAATLEDARIQLNQSDNEFLIVLNKQQRPIGLIGWRAIAMARSTINEYAHLI